MIKKSITQLDLKRLSLRGRVASILDSDILVVDLKNYDKDVITRWKKNL